MERKYQEEKDCIDYAGLTGEQIKKKIKDKKPTCKEEKATEKKKKKRKRNLKNKGKRHGRKKDK